MSEEQIKFAVQIPSNLLDGVKDYLTKQTDPNAFKITILDTETNDSTLESSHGAIVDSIWIGINIFGNLSLQIAIGLLSNYLYDKYKNGEWPIKFKTKDEKKHSFSAIDPDVKKKISEILKKGNR